METHQVLHIFSTSCIWTPTCSKQPVLLLAPLSWPAFPLWTWKPAEMSNNPCLHHANSKTTQNSGGISILDLPLPSTSYKCTQTCSKHPIPLLPSFLPWPAIHHFWLETNVIVTLFSLGIDTMQTWNNRRRWRHINSYMYFVQVRNAYQPVSYSFWPTSSSTLLTSIPAFH